MIAIRHQSINNIQFPPSFRGEPGSRLRVTSAAAAAAIVTVEIVTAQSL